MNLDKIKLVQHICTRLATLESDKDAALIDGRDASLMYVEMGELRKRLQDIMNNVPPVVNTVE